MLHRAYLLAGVILFILHFSVLAQDCVKSKAYRQCDFPDDTRFENKVNWSKSFRKGQTKQYVLTFTRGRQYFISICSKNIDVYLKLREDNEEKDILYDNAINELSGILELNIKETKKMILEISVPPNKINESKKIFTCVGIRIFHRKRK